MKKEEKQKKDSLLFVSGTDGYFVSGLPLSWLPRDC